MKKIKTLFHNFINWYKQHKNEQIDLSSFNNILNETSQVFPPLEKIKN